MGNEMIEIKYPSKIDNMPMSMYHNADLGWSKSSLDLVNKSMAHYFASQETPKEQTDAMLLGSAFHAAILQPSLYKSEYVLMPKIDRRTKAGKEEYQAFISESKGKTCIDSEQAATVEAMIKSVLEHPIASALFQNGEAEQSFFWIDETTGLKCKCRPDFLRHDKLVVDLKTTSDASYNAFQRTIYSYRYHVQGAFFLDGIETVTKEKHEEFILVAVETTSPYNVAVYRLDSESIAAGANAYRANLHTVKTHVKTKNAWPGYPAIVQDMILPPWAA